MRDAWAISSFSALDHVSLYSTLSCKLDRMRSCVDRTLTLSLSTYCRVCVRVDIYKDKAESKSYLHFEQLRLQKGIGLHCVPTLLAGSLDSGWRMVFRGDYYALAVTKYENFVQFASLYPEFTFVFIGDNGQGDVMAAAMMAAKLGARLECVFIKQVQPVHRTPGWSLDARDKWKKFVFFQTFIGAALEAAKRGLIHSSGVQRIGSHAISRLLEMKDVLNVADFDARRQEMNDDIHAANDYLSSLSMEVLPYIMAESTYPISAHVDQQHT